MITEVSEVQWKLNLAGRNLGMAFNSDYLKPIADSFNCSIKYILEKSKDELNFAIVVFCRGNNIVIPENFSYNPFWLNPKLSEKKQIEILTSLIKRLKGNYKKMSIKFNTDIYDVRPFIWENFSLDVRYTHFKTDNFNYDRSVIKNLTKDVINKYVFKVEDLDKQSLSINLESLSTLNFSTKKINRYRELLQAWALSGYLKAFNVYKGADLICSNLVLLDFNNSKAYTILLNKVDPEHKLAHTYLYDQIIKWCKSNHIDDLDFCGANIKGISEFKSRFNTELKMYFIVSFEPFQAKLRSLYKSIISRLPRL